MPKKSMENLTESMLYVLMAFHCRCLLYTSDAADEL